ncbi:hypothetical protein RRF57_013306 [Xylaria bambusicola]|uniref:Uncharacterized protein n=1 Tax=Xylaria bambusicola TaxID=326684 RepID=A0AAN7V2P3_9PEZI
MSGVVSGVGMWPPKIFCDIRPTQIFFITVVRVNGITAASTIGHPSVTVVCFLLFRLLPLRVQAYLLAFLSFSPSPELYLGSGSGTEQHNFSRSKHILQAIMNAVFTLSDLNFGKFGG